MSPLNDSDSGSGPISRKNGWESIAAISAKRHQTESPGIGEADPRAVLQSEDDMLVQRRDIRAPRGGLDQHPPGHAEMNDQRAGIVEREHEIFAAPAERENPAAREARFEIVRQRQAKVAPAHLDLGDPLALDGEAEAAADGFDFGQFGHRVWARFR